MHLPHHPHLPDFDWSVMPWQAWAAIGAYIGLLFVFAIVVAHVSKPTRYR